MNIDENRRTHVNTGHGGVTRAVSSGDWGTGGGLSVRAPGRPGLRALANPNEPRLKRTLERSRNKTRFGRFTDTCLEPDLSVASPPRAMTMSLLTVSYERQITAERHFYFILFFFFAFLPA